MKSNGTEKKFVALIKPTLKDRMGILLLFFVVMIIVCGLLGNLIRQTSLEPRTAILVASAIQCLLAFMLPSWLAAWLSSPNALRYLGFSTHSSLRQYVFVMVFMILITPFMNLVVEWNEGLKLPDSMNCLYQAMKSLEDSAAQTTEMILNVTSWGGLISGVLIIGCLTGLAEEMFFRGGLQRSMEAAGYNVHVAVWSAAFIFSLLHFQFFGFVPRLLLGAFFGYAYCYTGSLWVAAFMHALNNSWVVVISWLSARGDLPVNLDFDAVGTSGAGQIWGALLSLVLAALLVVVFGKSLILNKPGDAWRMSPVNNDFLRK